MLTYIHTVKVGDYLHSQSGEGGLSSGSSNGPGGIVLNYILWPALPSQTSPYTCFSLKLNFLFLAAGVSCINSSV